MIKIHHNIDLTQFHTFAIPHRAKALCTYDNADDIIEFYRKHENSFNRILPIGEGSNLLFTRDFDGCLLKSTNDKIQIESKNTEYAIVKVGAGMLWDDFVVWCIDNNFYGTENLSLIPGSIGACAVQNIGAYGAEAAQIINRVKGINIQLLKKQTFNHSECNFDYRLSIFKTDLNEQFIITDVYFKLALRESYNIKYGDVKQELEKLGKITLKNIRKVIVKIREEKLPDPKMLANAGSFFKNPVVDKQTAQNFISQHPSIPYYDDKNGNIKLAAGWLIDQCGLKGYKTSKGAAVHKNQALVLTNHGVENGKNIIELANYITDCVFEKFSIRLSPEVTIID